MPLLLPVQEVRQIVLERGDRPLPVRLQSVCPASSSRFGLQRTEVRKPKALDGEPQADKASRSGRSSRNSPGKF